MSLELTPEQTGRLNAASKPVLNCPADFNANLSTNFAHAAATVNGVPSQAGPNVPNEEQRW